MQSLSHLLFQAWEIRAPLTPYPATFLTGSCEMGWPLQVLWMLIFGRVLRNSACYALMKYTTFDTTNNERISDYWNSSKTKFHQEFCPVQRIPAQHVTKIMINPHKYFKLHFSVSICWWSVPTLTQQRLKGLERTEKSLCIRFNANSALFQRYQLHMSTTLW